MAMNRCPVCGEKYSDTYKECPFCEEEEALRDGEEIRRAPKRGKRVAHARSFSLVTPTLIVLIIIMAGLLVYLLYGDQLLQKSKNKTEDQQTTQITPEQPSQSGDSQTADESTDVTGDSTDADTQEPVNSTTTPSTATDYDALSALPSGLTLSTTDFTLSSVGETATIKVSGGNGSYTWVSEDEGVASVDENGKVTAVSKGTVNIVVSDGSKKGVCIVRCNVSGSSTTTITTPSTGSATTTTTTTTSGTLKAGSAVVTGGGNGVRVRSGPGTSYDALATIPNGGAVQIVQSAGDDWYQITFVGSGGQTVTGYMKGEFLANN